MYMCSYTCTCMYMYILHRIVRTAWKVEWVTDLACLLPLPLPVRVHQYAWLLVSGLLKQRYSHFSTANFCILGDLRGDHIKVEGYTQRQVKGKEVLASDAAALALKLMDLFFTKDEMATSNCTPAEGRKLLRQDVIAGIRCKSVHVTYNM